jgi:hypothetical protein
VTDERDRRGRQSRSLPPIVEETHSTPAPAPPPPRREEDPDEISESGGAAASLNSGMAPHRDIELNTLKMKEDSLAHGSSYSMREPVYDPPSKATLMERFVDSFKRDPNRQITPKDPNGRDAALEAGRIHHGAHYYDIHLANLQTAQSGLARKLKGRHLQMIAIGGSIGMSPSFSCGFAVSAAVVISPMN